MKKQILEPVDLKTRLEKEHNVQGHPKADLLYKIAWDIGHSCGENEVALYYADMVDLIKD